MLAKGLAIDTRGQKSEVDATGQISADSLDSTGGGFNNNVSVRSSAHAPSPEEEIGKQFLDPHSAQAESKHESTTASAAIRMEYEGGITIVMSVMLDAKEPYLEIGFLPNNDYEVPDCRARIREAEWYAIDSVAQSYWKDDETNVKPSRSTHRPTIVFHEVTDRRSVHIDREAFQIMRKTATMLFEKRAMLADTFAHGIDSYGMVFFTPKLPLYPDAAFTYDNHPSNDGKSSNHDQSANGVKPADGVQSSDVDVPVDDNKGVNNDKTSDDNKLRGDHKALLDDKVPKGDKPAYDDNPMESQMVATHALWLFSLTELAPTLRVYVQHMQFDNSLHVFHRTSHGVSSS